MIVFRPAEELRFFEKRCRQPIACIDETIDGLWLKGLGHHQEAIFVERFSLIWSEANEVQSSFPSLILTNRVV